MLTAHLMSHTISTHYSSVITHVGYHKFFSIDHHYRCWTHSPCLIIWSLCLLNLCSCSEISFSDRLFTLSSYLRLQATMKDIYVIARDLKRKRKEKKRSKFENKPLWGSYQTDGIASTWWLHHQFEHRKLQKTIAPAPLFVLSEPQPSQNPNHLTLL